MLRVGFAVIMMALAWTAPALATSEQNNQSLSGGVHELARVPVVFGGERRVAVRSIRLRCAAA